MTGTGLAGAFLILTGFLTCFFTPSAAQDRVTTTYFSADSLLITADEYMISDTLPSLVLLHEQGSSRGEFTDIAERFLKMNFNCLVPDIRNGGNNNITGNETARRCRQQGFSRHVDAVEMDIRASVNHAYEKSGQQVVLLGAGENGALALKIAAETEAVRAVIALSPGEFFQPHFRVQDTIAGMEKKILVLSSKMELPYMEQLTSGISEQFKTLFAPVDSPGERGTDALRPGQPSHSEYWLNILLFFKDLQ